MSSIKRIIAEEGDAPAARRRAARGPAPRAIDGEDDDEVLELSDRLSDVRPFELRGAEPAPEPRRVEEPRIVPVTEPAEEPRMAAAPIPRKAEEPRLAEPRPILSPGAEQASRGSLEALSRLMVKPEVTGSDTLEGMVREMLRPMLRDWLDANLPTMVEDMVASEIRRITGQPG